MLAIDIETYDPNLKNIGDGAIRKDGAVICIGLYDGTDFVCVAPTDPRLKDWLASDEPKVFHNAPYDLSWLMFGLGFKVNGVLHDTMTRAALIDEYMDLDLDTCCKKFKVAGKNYDDTLDKWWQDHRSLYELRGNLWNNIDVVWATPAGRDALIRYNKQDCVATYNLFYAQEKDIEHVLDAYKIECDMIHILMEMKKNGIRVDLVNRDRFTQQIEKEKTECFEILQYQYSITEQIARSPKQLTTAMNDLGIKSPVITPSGGQSWAADVLDLIDHPVVETLQRARNLDALLSKYLHASMCDCIVGDRIHATFTANKRDDGGTITGRLACKAPNLQNIPARDDKHGQKSYGQEMRAMFIPEEGCMLGAFDYSAIEYRLLAHYAVGRQAEWIRQQVRDGIDLHTAAQEMTGIKNRDIIKRMNFGFIYGMGINKLMKLNRRLFIKLAAEANMPLEQFGQHIYNLYHTNLPVIKDTMNAIQQEAKAVGYVTSISGRRHHKPRPVFENNRWNDGIYKMTNYRIQGCASDVLKKGLVDAWHSGVFKVLKLHLSVHDENVVSIPYNHVGTQAAITLQEIMQNAYEEQLVVPMQVVGEVGPHWGYWNGDILEDMRHGRYVHTC